MKTPLLGQQARIGYSSGPNVTAVNSLDQVFYFKPTSENRKRWVCRGLDAHKPLDLKNYSYNGVFRKKLAKVNIVFLLAPFST